MSDERRKPGGDKFAKKGRGGSGGRKRSGGFRKKRPPANLKFDYKNVHDLTPFLTEEGKIVPARVSGLSAHQQRQLTLSVKRARNVGFISAVRREAIR